MKTIETNQTTHPNNVGIPHFCICLHPGPSGLHLLASPSLVNSSPVFCLLSPVFCLLSPVFCLLSPVFCLLSAVSCLLSPVFCLLLIPPIQPSLLQIGRFSAVRLTSVPLLCTAKAYYLVFWFSSKKVGE